MKQIESYKNVRVDSIILMEKNLFISPKYEFDSLKVNLTMNFIWVKLNIVAYIC